MQRRLFLCFGLLALLTTHLLPPQRAEAQFFDAAPTLDGICSESDYVSSGNWAVGWDDTYLYVCKIGGATDEPVRLFLDLNPTVVPVNGGGGGNGSLSGSAVGSVDPNHPFRADVAVEWTTSSLARRDADESGGWSSLTSSGLNQGTNGSDREMRLEWSALAAASGRPTHFNWYGYAQTAGGSIYDPTPSANPTGSISAPNHLRYFTVSSTANDASITGPFSQESYTHLGASISDVGALSVYDFTMNTSNRFVQRDATGNWSIANDLVVGAGVVRFDDGGAGGTTTVGGDVRITGGLLDMKSTDEPLVVNGTLDVFDFPGSELRLSQTAGGNAHVAGDLNAAGTVTPNSGVVRLTSSDGRIATISDDSGLGNNDITYERHYSGSTANAGWRLLSSPFASVAFSALNDDFHTQGATGADFQNGDPNLFAFDPTQLNADDRWTAVGDYSNSFGAGVGYAFFMFENEVGGSPLLPGPWDATGQEHGGPVSPSLAPHDATGTTSNFNLVGNPFGGPLDWEAVHDATSNVSATYHVWNPDAQQYATYQAGGIDNGAGRYIAPFQGFFIETSGSTPSITFEKTMKANNASPNIFGVRTSDGQTDDGRAPHLMLALRGEELQAARPILIFKDTAEAGADASDAGWLPPLSTEHAALWIQDEERRLIFDARAPADGEATYALGVEATRAGTYTLSWPRWHDVPDDWSLTLIDEATDAEIDLRTDTSYTFELDAPKADVRSTPRSPASLATTSTAADPRFTLRVTVPTEDSSPRPEAIALRGNRPNPFRTTTTLQYELPEPTTVELAVYDVMGRKVATLASGIQEPGVHTVTWDASPHASGLYFARLNAGGTHHTRKMVVLR